jgi:hypothetical protein
MLSFWNSLESVSYWSTVSQVTVVVIGAVALLLGMRASHLSDLQQEKKDEMLSAATMNAEIASTEVKRLNAQLAPRAISKEQAEFIVSFLTLAPKGPVKVARSSNSNETTNFMTQIKNVLSKAGYNVSGNYIVDGPPLIRKGPGGTEGIAIVIKSFESCPPYTDDIQEAFRQVGIPIDGTVKDNDPSFVGDSEMVIYITDKK